MSTEFGSKGSLGGYASHALSSSSLFRDKVVGATQTLHHPIRIHPAKYCGGGQPATDYEMSDSLLLKSSSRQPPAPPA